METYSEIVSALADWTTSRPGAILIMSATLPLPLLLKQGRSLSFGALAVCLGAAMFIWFGIESLAGAFLIVLANSFLVSVALLSSLKRLTQIEDRMALVMSALDNLEVAEERRQTYGAKHSLVSRFQPRRKPEAGTTEQIVTAGATDGPAREMQVIPGPPWQELQGPDLRLETVAPVSTRPKGRDPVVRKKSNMAAFKLNGSAGDSSRQLKLKRPQKSG
ncbi:MAG: hypothetical protein ABIQ51_18890 [Mesorhizobium sp.]